jgi:hypothetical protein
MNEPAVIGSLIKHSLWMFVMIMTETLVVIEKHIIFMVRQMASHLSWSKRFAYPKDLLLSRDLLMQGATLQFLLDWR